VSWEKLPVLGIPPQEPLGARRPGRGQQIGSIFDPVRVVTLAGSANTGVVQTADLGTFSPPDGSAMLYVVGQITGVGGGFSTLYLYSSPAAADPLAFGVSPAATISGSVAGWVPQVGRLSYAVQLGSATSYTGYLDVAGWIRNP
jgi:hypothetical protein